MGQFSWFVSKMRAFARVSELAPRKPLTLASKPLVHRGTQSWHNPSPQTISNVYGVGTGVYSDVVYGA